MRFLKGQFRALFCLLIFYSISTVTAAPGVRLKDIAYLSGVRNNQLLGIGLVTGLAGKGDSSSSVLLKNSIANLITNLGLEIDQREIKSRNSAVVVISCEIPPFIRPGDRINLTVSSIGDARSLEGGVLLQSQLKGANGVVYALAQGNILTPRNSGSVKTVGSIPLGGIVEKEVLSEFITQGTISLVLRNPDFITAHGVSMAISEAFPNVKVSPVDASLIEVQIPAERRSNPVAFIAELESLTVIPGSSGKVVIDAASGIIIMGEQVRIGRVAVSYKRVQISVAGNFNFQDGEEAKENFILEETSTVDDLISALTEVGLKTETIIGILKAIDRAGALYGELIIM